MIKYLKGLSKGKFRAWKWCSYIAYFFFSIFIPVLTVCIQYDLFGNTGTKTKLSGWGIVLLIIACVVGFFALKRAIAKLDDLNPAAAYFKVVLNTVSKLILPVVAIIVVFLLKSNFELASDTIYWMCASYIAAGLIDGILITFIDRESRIRNKSLLDKEALERQNLV